MSAKELISMLAARHADDVFVPECKDGPTQGTTHFRLDGWAMRRSWSNPCVWGYETKVTRRDFVQDQKWQQYLPLCNQLYFVAPKGIIQENELSADVGLLVVAGSRLVCKKKAAHRQVEIPDSLWRYILMCRTSIRGENSAGDAETERRDRTERYAAWAADSKHRKILGSLIGSKITERMDELVRRNERLTEYRKATKLLERRLRETGVDPDDPGWIATHKIAAFVERLAGDFQHVDRACQELERSISGLRDSVRTAKKPIGEFAEVEQVKA